VTLRADLLAERREQLLAQSARLRHELGSEAAELTGRFGLVERIAALGRSPLVRMALSAGATLLFFGRTRRLVGVASRLLVLYPLIRRVAGLFNRRP
jgi:hypothetical protein